MLDDLTAKNYSLNYKQYLAQSAVEVDGFEMVKLGDICDINFGERVTKKDNVGVLYPVYGGGNDTFRTDKKNREGITCKVSRFGISEHNCVQIIHGDYWLMDSGFTITAKENKAVSSYIWNWLLQNKKAVYQCGRATAQMNMDMEAFKLLQIPLPSLERQQQIVEAIDGWASLAQQEEVALKILEKQVMFQVKEMGRDQARVKLGEVCDIKCGKSMPKTEIVEGNVPVVGGGITPMGFHNSSTHEAYTPMISQRGTAGYVSRYSTKTWITSNAVIPTLKNNLMLMNNDILYYLLKCNEESFYNIVVKTAQPMLTVGNLLLVEVQLPPLTEQQTLQSDFDEIRHKHAKIATYKAKAQEAIQRLMPGATASEPAPAPEPVPTPAPVETKKKVKLVLKKKATE
jgi:restriction endonuclease S subunit